MPHALLLSPDDQAVSAITGVLDEMSVTCERPLDGPSAAKKLNSESFDLVLVDCENLPAAKLIFDVCRRPSAGVNPIPIAIVDGRAGLPTAFRLGAELILTKPVAKDQARTTIRTAVNRVKKDETPHPPHLFEERAQETAPVSAEPRVAAAAAGVSATAVHAAEVKPAVQPETSIEPPQTPEAKTHAAAQPALKPALSSKAIPGLARDLTPPQSFAPPKIAPPAPAPAPKPPDDPVLADLESDLPSPVFASYAQPKTKKGLGSIWFLLILMLGGGGFYAAWMYQPGFREKVQPWVNRGIAALHVPGQSQAKVAVQRPVAPAPPVSTGTEKALTNATPAQPANPGPGAATLSGAPQQDANTAAANVNSAPPTVTGPSSGTPAQPANNAAEAESDDAGTPSAEKPASDTKTENSTKKILAAVPSDTELPGEKSAVILSSQGAEKRLLHQVPAVYPAEARKERIEGTVVLKTVVNDAGKVAGVRVVEGNPTLAPAAISAVKQWRYRPYIRNGKAMSFQTIVLVDFQH